MLTNFLLSTEAANSVSVLSKGEQWIRALHLLLSDPAASLSPKKVNFNGEEKEKEPVNVKLTS